MALQNDKAVFLDRDGVICPEKGYVSSLEQLEIFPFAREAVMSLKKAQWRIFIVTNQSGVARRLFTEEDLGIIHNHLLQEIPVDKIYYCPHHPQGIIGLPYSVNCDCRKPQPGLIYRAARENRIDLSRSYLVGDRPSDVLTGKNAGVATVLVRSGWGANTSCQDVGPDLVFADLREFAEYLIRQPR